MEGAGVRVRRLCTFPGCDREHVARGYCNAHYLRLRRCGEVSDRVPRLCTFPGCERKHSARGYCDAHYLRLWRYEEVSDLAGYVYDDNERFWQHVTKTDGCWLWTGLTINGYGITTKRGIRSNIRAHRFSYELHVGPIPEDITIDHLCHDLTCPGGAMCEHKRCVNPKHLGLATRAENARRGNLGRRRTRKQASLAPSSPSIGDA